MKTIELKDITIGNFQYDATVEVTPEQEKVLLEQGALRLFQGQPSGKWEKEMAYPGKDAKRPEKFTRKDIPFSQTGADTLVKVLSDVKIEIGRNEKDEKILEDLAIDISNVREYTGAVAAEPKYKAEKDLLNLYLFEADGKTAKLMKDGTTPRSAATFAESRGLAAPTEPWDEDTEFLASVKAWYKAQAASQD